MARGSLSRIVSRGRIFAHLIPDNIGLHLNSIFDTAIPGSDPISTQSANHVPDNHFVSGPGGRGCGSNTPDRRLHFCFVGIGTKILTKIHTTFNTLFKNKCMAIPFPPPISQNPILQFKSRRKEPLSLAESTHPCNAGLSEDSLAWLENTSVDSFSRTPEVEFTLNPLVSPLCLLDSPAAAGRWVTTGFLRASVRRV